MQAQPTGENARRRRRAEGRAAMAAAFPLPRSRGGGTMPAHEIAAPPADAVVDMGASFAKK
jgi:hypothetical protein